jgi:hypothetical protein
MHSGVMTVNRALPRTTGLAGKAQALPVIRASISRGRRFITEKRSSFFIFYIPNILSTAGRSVFIVIALILAFLLIKIKSEDGGTFLQPVIKKLI